MGVMLSATDSLNWLSRITATTPANLTNSLGTNLRKPADMRFLPYLAGERTPHNDARIRGAFTGLATNSGTDDLTQAVLEGVSFGLRDSLEALRSTGAGIDALTAIGGGSASEYWLALLATVLGVPLKIPAAREFGAALGAARLSIIAAGSGDPDDIFLAPKSGAIVEPKTELVGAFDDAYQAFQAAYSGVKEIQ